MRIIQNGQKEILDLVGQRNHSSDMGADRLHRYCLTTPYNGEVLIYNLVTSALIALENDELERFIKSDYAVDHLFAVPEQFEEKRLVDDLKEFLSRKGDSVSKYTIYTTTHCNARCYYCFENGGYKKHMSMEVANKVIELIDRTADADKPLELSWFGGEPTVNAKVIDYICNHYKSHGREFFSTMVSNAYLLNRENIKKARELWNLKWVLITIDGYGQEYNAIKNYINDDTDAFATVMDNIEAMLDHDIVVAMTLRANGSNEDSLMKLIDYLTKRFSNRENLLLNCQMIHPKSAGIYVPGVRETEQKMLESQKKILKALFDAGLYRANASKTFKAFQCDSCSGKAMNIHPDGNIACCLCYLDGANTGSVYEEGLDQTVLDSFKEKYAEVEECSTCKMYPRCIRLKRCDNASDWCTAQKRENEEYRAVLQMINTYKAHQST